jgi:hypothetical protein
VKGIVLVFLSLFFPLLLCTIQQAKNYTPHEINATFIWFFVLVSCFQRNLETQNYMCHEENFQFFEKLLCYPMSLNFAPHETIYIYNFPSSFSYYQKNQIIHLMTYCFLNLFLLLFFSLLFYSTKEAKLCTSQATFFWAYFCQLVTQK